MQSELFKEFMTAQREVYVLTDCETLCYAFKLGARIMLDVLTEGKMKANGINSIKRYGKTL